MKKVRFNTTDTKETRWTQRNKLKITKDPLRLQRQLNTAAVMFDREEIPVCPFVSFVVDFFLNSRRGRRLEPGGNGVAGNAATNSSLRRRGCLWLQAGVGPAGAAATAAKLPQLIIRTLSLKLVRPKGDNGEGALIECAGPGSSS